MSQVEAKPSAAAATSSAIAEAPADSTCSHSGILTCGAARETTAITSGEREKRCNSALAPGLVERGIVLQLEFERDPARPLAPLARERR